MNLLHAWQKYLAGNGVDLLTNVADILLVAAGIYWLIMLSKRTRTMRLIWGLMIFLALVWVTEHARFHTINYLLRSFLPLGPVAIVIFFYPELRHALEDMGQWGTRLTVLEKKNVTTLVPVIVRATCRMSEQQIGALIVIEQEDKLEEIAATGTRLDATVSEELISSIFNPGGALHDGAVLIRGSRIIAAGCTLPLSESTHVGRMIHTRHKAALGVAEESDAAVVVCSEETGTISLALEGKLHRGLNEETLTQWLRSISGLSDERIDGSKFEKKVDGTLRKAGFRLK